MAHVDPAEAPTGTTIHFDGTASQSHVGSLAAYDWDFGDGSHAGGPEAAGAQHTYSSPGLYEATLTVTDRAGQRAWQTLAVGVDLVEDLRGAVARPRPGGTGTPVGWDHPFHVGAHATTVLLHLDAVQGAGGQARVSLKLLDPAGVEVWTDSRAVGSGGSSFTAVLPQNALGTEGTWLVRASADLGGAGLLGSLGVLYTPPLAGPLVG